MLRRCLIAFSLLITWTLFTITTFGQSQQDAPIRDINPWNEISPYYEYVRTKVASTWDQSTPCTSPPIVQFKLDRNGQISEVGLNKSCGNWKLDKAYVERLEGMRLNPFPPSFQYHTPGPLILRIDLKTGLYLSSPSTKFCRRRVSGKL